MEINKGRVTCRQAVLILLLIGYPSLLWWTTNLVSFDAKQAAWLVPLPGTIIYLYISKQLNYLIMQNPNLSLLECIEKYTNKFIGKLYGILIAILLLYQIIDVPRYLSESLLSSSYPNVSSEVFTLSSLIVMSLIIKFGFSILARISELLVFYFTFMVIFIIILLLPNVSISRITPISYLDILPVMKSSFTFIIPLTLNAIVILILGDNIENKNHFMKYIKQTSLIYFFISTFFLISVIGKFGYYFLQNTPFSLVIGSKYLTIQNFIAGFESLIITIILLGQIIYIILYIFSLFRVLKYLFNIKHDILFVNIILILIYAYSKLIAKNIDIDMEFYVIYITPFVFLVIIIPIIIIWINRIKLAIKKNSR